ncbi:MAG TPA: hypothetical protein VK116_17495, partial [Planctomycetota bacterium]|nr:hypothetical protein [Planctomycetota bacterium]
PIRGSRAIFRLDGDFALVWAYFRVVREPVDAADPVVSESDVREILRSEGIDAPLYVELLYSFVDGPDLADPMWIVGFVGEQGGVERVYSALSGEMLGERSTVSGWQGAVAERRVEVALDGFCPPVDDPFAIPSIVPRSASPLAGVELSYSFEGLGDNASGSLVLDADGRGVIEGELPDAPIMVQARLLPDGVDDEHADYVHVVLRDDDGDGVIERTFNPERTIEGSAHLLAALHLAKAEREIEAALARAGIARVAPDDSRTPFDLRPPRIEILLDRNAHHYDSLSRTITLGSDERSFDARDDAGRLAKLVPTIVYHELAHHVIRRLSGSDQDRAVNEGIADALAALISGQSKVGHGPEGATADPWARDLAREKGALSDVH